MTTKRMVEAAAVLILIGFCPIISAQDNGEPLQSAKRFYEQEEFKKIIDLYKNRISTGTMTADENHLFSAAVIYDFQLRSQKMTDRFFLGHLPLAEKVLSETRISDPGNMSSLYLYGLILHYKKQYPESEKYLRQTAEKNESFSVYGFPTVMDLLTDNLTKQKKYSDIKSLLSKYPDKSGMQWICLSAAERGLGVYDSSAAHFNKGIQLLNDPLRLEQLFTDVRDIAEKSEIHNWKALNNNSDKIHFLIRFWKQRDPDPLDMINERLDEHYQRLDYAREYYPLFHSSGYDERGMVYIRFGKPNIKLTDGQIETSNSNSFSQIESWIYNEFNEELEFDFINTAGIYELRPLSDILPTYEPLAVIDLLKERAKHNGHLMAIYSHLDNQIKDYINRNPGVSSKHDYRYQRIFFDFQLKVEDLFRKTAESNKLYTDLYQKRQQIPINVQTNTFKGNDGKSRLDFSYMIPVKSLTFSKKSEQDQTSTTEIKVNYTIFDSAYAEVSFFEKTYQIESAKSDDIEHYFVDEIRSELMPGNYLAAIRIVNNDKEQTGIYQLPVIVNPFDQSDFRISTIQIASKTASPPIGQKFIKPNTNTEVVPNPIAALNKQNPLILYYEIYGLTLDPDGKSRYTVSYRIQNTQVKRNLFQAIGSIFKKNEKSLSQTTTRTGESTRSAETIGFDVSPVDPGNVTMEITIQDLNTGRKSVVSRELTLY